jgi:hypothetical protein
MQSLHIYKKEPYLDILEVFYIFRGTIKKGEKKERMKGEREKKKSNQINNQHTISHNKISDITQYTTDS